MVAPEKYNNVVLQLSGSLKYLHLCMSLTIGENNLKVARSIPNLLAEQRVAACAYICRTGNHTASILGSQNWRGISAGSKFFRVQY